MDTVRLETRYGMADGLTPTIAARIAECASRYRAHVSIESEGRTIRIESLISVLSMDTCESYLEAHSAMRAASTGVKPSAMP